MLQASRGLGFQGTIITENLGRNDNDDDTHGPSSNFSSFIRQQTIHEPKANPSVPDPRRFSASTAPQVPKCRNPWTVLCDAATGSKPTSPPHVIRLRSAVVSLPPWVSRTRPQLAEPRNKPSAVTGITRKQKLGGRDWDQQAFASCWNPSHLASLRSWPRRRQWPTRRFIVCR